jgi:hypothetical protein
MTRVDHLPRWLVVEASLQLQNRLITRANACYSLYCDDLGLSHVPSCTLVPSISIAELERKRESSLQPPLWHYAGREL